MLIAGGLAKGLDLTPLGSEPGVRLLLGIGEAGHAITRIIPGQNGQVHTHGEIWTATADEMVEERDTICVVGVKGLTLTVRRTGSQSNDGHVAQGGL